MPRAPRFRLETGVIVFLSAVYALSWLGYYAKTPLGQEPAFNERQLLYAADTIAAGATVPPDLTPAPAYPLLLSWLPGGGGDPGHLAAARTLNLAALLTLTVFTLAVSRRLWNDPTATVISGLLVGLNPVFVFMVGDPGPFLPGIALFTAGLWWITVWHRRPRPRRAAAAGLAIACAGAFLPAAFIQALAWPLVAAAAAGRPFCIFTRPRSK